MAFVVTESEMVACISLIQGWPGRQRCPTVAAFLIVSFLGSFILADVVTEGHMR